MNILYIVPYVPSLVRVRPYQFIRGLTKRGHKVTVRTSWSKREELDELDQLKAEAFAVEAEPLSRLRPFVNMIKALPTAEPLQAAYCWQPVMAEELRHVTASKNGLEPFDIVHVEHLRGARYGIDLKANPNFNIPIVWDSVDCISQLFRQAASNGASKISRLVTRFELPRTERYEGWLLNQFDRVVATSQHDAAALHHLNPGAQGVSIVPNGVDQSYFTSNETLTRKPSAIVMTGKMSYHANVSMVMHFVRDVLPRIWTTRRDAQLWVVGKNPPKEVQRLQEHPLITVTGTVPDIRPYLRAAAVAVAPTPYSAGIQNKVLEAMACGTPVVASPQAVAALGVMRGRDLVVADDPDTFAGEVIALLNDSGARRSLGRAGRRFVEMHHEWGDSVRKLEDIYSELIYATG